MSAKLVVKKKRECTKSQVHSLTHVTNGHLVAFRHGDVGGVHQKVLQNFLHTRHLLLLRSGNKRWDARSLHEFLSQIRLELLEVLVGRFGDEPQILSEGLCVLLEKTFRALQHLEFPYSVHKNSSKLWCVPA